MKLHKTLQRVDLESLGKFIQRITSVGYGLEDIDILLDHKYFAADFDEDTEESLEEVGMFIVRTIRIYRIEDIIEILDTKLME